MYCIELKNGFYKNHVDTVYTRDKVETTNLTYKAYIFPSYEEAQNYLENFIYEPARVAKLDYNNEEMQKVYKDIQEVLNSKAMQDKKDNEESKAKDEAYKAYMGQLMEAIMHEHKIDDIVAAQPIQEDVKKETFYKTSDDKAEMRYIKATTTLNPDDYVRADHTYSTKIYNPLDSVTIWTDDQKDQSSQKEFDKIKATIENYKYLPNNWDGHESGPISEKTIKAILVFLDFAFKIGNIKVDYVYPTSEEGIHISLYDAKSGATILAEVGDDGQIGVALKKPNEETIYKDYIVENGELVIYKS